MMSWLLYTQLTSSAPCFEITSACYYVGATKIGHENRSPVKIVGQKNFNVSGLIWRRHNFRILVLLLTVCDNLLFCHRELRPTKGQMLYPITTQWCVRVCVDGGLRCALACGVQTLSSFFFVRWWRCVSRPAHNTGRPASTDRHRSWSQWTSEVAFLPAQFARRSFSDAAPLTWNLLPPDVFNCGSLSLSTFKSRLKTHLFSTAFC